MNLPRNKEGFKTYWINTGTDPLIRERILKPNTKETYNTLQKLVSGETIQRKLDEDFIFPDFDTDKELLWTLLTFSGYLTQEGETEQRTIYNLRVPNYEIKTVFQDIIMKWLLNDVNIQRRLVYATAQHLVNNRLAEFEEGFRHIMGDTFSYFDTAGDSERVYQAYVLGLLAVIGDHYVIRSNRESGAGRYDIMLLPHDKTRSGVVMELKQIERKENEDAEARLARVNDKLAEAYQQIEEKQYYKELVAHQIEHIIKVPVVFVGKEVYVGKEFSV